MRKIKVIEAELKEYEGLLAAAVEADEKKFMEDLIADLKDELAKAKDDEKTPPAKKSIPKETKVKKIVKKPKEEHFIEVNGKKISQSDDNFCDALTEQWEQRLKQRAKAGGKKKTRSIMQQVASTVASTVIKGIKTIETEDLEKNPKAEMKKVKRLEAASVEYMSAFKDIVGEKLTQKEIAEEFDGVHKVITQIEKKYIKSKK